MVNRMDNREAIKILSDICKAYRNFTTEEICALELAIKALKQEPSVWDDKGELTEYGEKCREHILEQEPCEMTAEEYRQRMIQAFHNADCGELIAVCVLPTEKEFEYLEWLLKNHYKKEPCEDAISRAMAKKIIKTYVEELDASDLDGKQYAIRGAKTVGMLILDLPSVSVAENVGRWEKTDYRRIDQTGEVYIDGEGLRCSNCAHCFKEELLWKNNYCPNCGARMNEPQESEVKDADSD